MKDSCNSINDLVKHALTAFTLGSCSGLLQSEHYLHSKVQASETFTYGWQCLEMEAGGVWGALKLQVLQDTNLSAGRSKMFVLIKNTSEQKYSFLQHYTGLN